MENTTKTADLGRRLKELRRRRGLSLRGCAGKAGVAPSFLSKVEAGKASPTIMTLQKILEALGTNLGEFFAAPPPAGESRLICPRRRMKLVADRDRRWLFAFPGRDDIRAVLTCEEYRPRTKVLERERHPGDLLGLVLAGELALQTNDGAVHRARKGDAFHIPADLEHVARNGGRTRLKLAVVQLRPDKK